LVDHRQVSAEKAQQLADKLNLMYFETSAKSGSNIKTMFNEMAKRLTGIETNPISDPQIAEAPA
jgi:hypothetical protein